MRKSKIRFFVIIVIITLLIISKIFQVDQFFTLETLKNQQNTLQNIFKEFPAQFIFYYFLVYVTSTALSLPGATILTLAGGLFFGFWRGLLIVSFASTVGATCAFLVSRFLLRDLIQKKFKEKLGPINEGIKKEGGFYLFTLRLVPLFPFFLVNLVMGLTTIRTTTFFFVSQLGMLAGTAAYVNAGTQLGQINSLNDILSSQLILSFTIIGALPLFSKIAIRLYRSKAVLRYFKKPHEFDYNVVVIGGGSAGLVSAYIAAAVKAKVALIEKHKMGGDCLNTGCVPSKALVRSSKILSYFKRAENFGLKKVEINFNFSDVMQRIQKVISKVEPHDSVERYSKLGVDCIQGSAKILTPYSVEVNNKTLTTKNIIVATGASPLLPLISGLDKIEYLTSDNIWNLKSQPKRLIILGGGPIGCEFAQSFRRLGSEVTVVEQASHIMNREDEDVSQLITEKFRSEGINVLTKHRAVSFEATDTKKYLFCETEEKNVSIEFDEVFIALGRKPNIKGFGLEELDIEISQGGAIKHDAFLRTNYPNIYVCGDVAGPYQFTHTAAHQAWYAAVNALFSPFKKFKVDYRVIPWATFTDPEIARVGLNEKEAKLSGIAYETTKYGIDDLDRAITDEEELGFVKILTPPGKDEILGVTIVGAQAGDTIAEYIIAMKYGLGLNKILNTIHIYPTYSEANKYAAGIWKKAHAPKTVLKCLRIFHSWRRERF